MSSSSTLTQLVNLLTRPLIFHYPAITVVQLQLALQANLSTLFNTQLDTFAPFTLHLSAHTLPIPPIYVACLSLGLRWEEWVVALSGDKDLYVFVMEGCIRVGVPGATETVVVWKEELETKTLTASKLQAMLDSARARKQANTSAQASTHTYTVTLPTLRITPSTPLLPSPSEPSSPVSATSSSSSDSDSDSDTESTFSSQSSQSSVSSNSTLSSPSKTKPCSNAFDTPFFIPTTTTTTKAKVPISISRAQRRREWVAQAPTSHTPTSRVANANANPNPNAKATITKYTYQGGQTGVMTGGVMLSGGGKGSGAAAATTGTGTGKGMGAGSGAANWRRRRI